MSTHPVRVYAPHATSVTSVRFDDTGSTEVQRVPLAREGDDWIGTVGVGTVFAVVTAGDGARFDASKVLLDPSATEVVFPPGHSRVAASKRGVPNSGKAPLAKATAWPSPRPQRRSSRAPIVYEAHVRGMTATHPEAASPGTYRALIGQLDRIAALGFSVIELLPVHQSDPQEGSYWGYMPLAFGAVHRQYAAGDGAAGELAELIAAAHGRDLEVWIDVVYNHTTEVDASGPTYHLRGLADGDYYRLDENGSYIETTGCGNDIDTSSPAAQRLIIESLDRYADLGADGFRFDLASVLSRHRPFIAALDEWATRRGVRMIAEPWDAVGTYELGRAWPSLGWLQWNDRFREDVRGFLRGEAGLVPALMRRVQGSPDVFYSPAQTVNFVTSHDGFTLYDVVAYDRKHNEANGHANTDGAADNRSWNCGFEGDDGAPADVLALRRRQLRNAWCLLAMSHGTPMAVMGDEFGRTQGGNNNAYNQDNETSWVDWRRRDRFADLERFVSGLLALRHRHPVLAQPDWWGDAVQWFGTSGPPDSGDSSRSLAWCVGDLYVIANAYWEPLTFALQAPGRWRRVVDTSLGPPDDIVESADAATVGATYDVAARSVVILERERRPLRVEAEAEAVEGAQPQVALAGAVLTVE
jgi:isoamylase